MCECNNALGFHVSNFFNKMLDINNCYLQSDIFRLVLLTRLFLFFRNRDYIFEKMERLKLKIKG